MRNTRFTSYLAIVALLLVVLSTHAAADAGSVQRLRLKGYCTGVLEPDLLEVWLGPHDGSVSVRLVGLDRDSIEQAYPLYAQLFTRGCALDRPVSIEVVEKDASGLITGRVIADHEDVSFALIAEGLARYNGMAPASMRLHMAEEQAREAGRGLWAPDDDEEVARQQQVARELRLGDIAWQLDARRAAAPGEPVTAVGQGVVAAVEGEEEPRLQMSLGSWVGADTSLVVAHWGEPTRIEPGEQGGSVLVYERCGPAATSDTACRVLFFTDAEGTIIHRTWESG